MASRCSTSCACPPGTPCGGSPTWAAEPGAPPAWLRARGVAATAAGRHAGDARGGPRARRARPARRGRRRRTGLARGRLTSSSPRSSRARATSGPLTARRAVWPSPAGCSCSSPSDAPSIMASGMPTRFGGDVGRRRRHRRPRAPDGDHVDAALGPRVGAGRDARGPHRDRAGIALKSSRERMRRPAVSAALAWRALGSEQRRRSRRAPARSTSAGRKLPTFTSVTPSSLRLIPMISTPPALVSAASASLPSARISSNRPAASEMPPWTTRIVIAAKATPGPSDAASAIEAKPSSSAFVASAS